MTIELQLGKIRMPKPTPEQIIESTVTMARAILESNALEQHKRDFLRGCVWLVTEAQGKYNVPYWSEGVYELVQAHGSIKEARKHTKIQHEHVFPRHHIAEQIMNDPTCLENVLREQAVACLVTKDEHSRLKHTPPGFARYKAEGIGVWDVKAQNWYTIE